MSDDVFPLLVAGIQALAAAGTVAAALAAWRAVKHAPGSAKATREAVLMPLKQKHNRRPEGLTPDPQGGTSVRVAPTPWIPFVAGRSTRSAG